MKTLKNLLIGLMTLITMNSFATVHNVTYGTTTSVTCQVGDTLKFYDMVYTSISQYVYVGMTQIFYGVPSSGYLCQYVITGGETAVTIFISGPNSWTTSVNVGTTTSINESDISNSIKVYPNPVTDILKISSNRETKIDIYTISGRLVLSKDIEIGENVISFLEYPSGVYIVNVGGILQKIVK